MKETILYLLQNLLVIDGLILLLAIFERMFCWNVGHLWRKVLWLMICIRMLIPVEIHLWDINEKWTGVQFEIQVETIKSPPLVSEIDAPVKKDGIQVYEPVREAEVTLPETLPEKTLVTGDQKNEMTPKDILKEYWYLLLAAIWITGVMVALFCHILQYFFVKEFYFEDSCPCTDTKILSIAEECAKRYHLKWKPQLYVKEKAASPMTFGYFRRKIIFPPHVYDADELTLILQHEMTHLKFGDAWYKTFLLFICDLYWFNPVFWLMKRMAYRDVEYVCDEVPSLVQLSCSQKELKRRLNNLFEFRNWHHGLFPLLISTVLIAILVMGISFTVKEIPQACGIDLGHCVKSVAYYGDIFIDGAEDPDSYTRDYSPYFIPISVEEIKTKIPQF